MENECCVQIVIDRNGSHGYTGKFVKSSFWMVCETHRIELSGPFPDGYVSCPVGGVDLILPATAEVR